MENDKDDNQRSVTLTSNGDELRKTLDSLQKRIAITRPAVPTTPRTSINEEIARAEKLKNDDAEQDIKLKRQTLDLLFAFLAVETFLIFWYTFLQATKVWNFHLDEWSFKLVISATLAQITAMLFVAVNYLFPKKR